MTLHLNFGGAPCPFEWGVIPELICNLATAILLNVNWKPDELHAPNQDKFPEPQFFPDDSLFGKGRELIVNVDVNKFGIHNIYIDDLIALESTYQTQTIVRDWNAPPSWQWTFVPVGRTPTNQSPATRWQQGKS
jgi:hypothetical protein